MRKRVIIFGLAFIMLFSLLMFTGCSEYSGREIEVDGWTLFRFRQSGQVNIISANSESLVVDGVLYIPSRIGRYNIHGFGRWQPTGWYGGIDHYFRISESLEVERVVLAAELHVGRYFWGDDWRYQGNVFRIAYIELLCKTFERVSFIGRSEKRRYVIIPDGTSCLFFDNFKGLHYSGMFYVITRFIEKSEWLANQN